MTVAHYMSFIPDDISAGDRIGGRPTVYPDIFPWDAEFDGDNGFLAQFRVDGDRLRLPGYDWLQLYQSFEEGGIVEPIPILIAHGGGNPSPPLGRMAPLHPEVPPCRIEYTEREDPDVISPGLPQGVDYVYFSKLGGIDPFFEPDELVRFLGQISSIDTALNFADMSCGIYILGDSEVRVDLR